MFGKFGRYRIAYKSLAFRKVPNEVEGIGKCLKSSALPKRQWAVFGRMDHLALSCAGNRLGRFIGAQTAQPCGSTASSFCWHPVSDPPVGASLVAFMLEVRRQVSHRLARL